MEQRNNIGGGTTLRESKNDGTLFDIWSWRVFFFSVVYMLSQAHLTGLPGFSAFEPDQGLVNASP